MKKIISWLLLAMLVSALSAFPILAADAAAEPGQAEQTETTVGESPDGESPDGESPEGESPDGESPNGEAPEGAAAGHSGPPDLSSGKLQLPFGHWVNVIGSALTLPLAILSIALWFFRAYYQAGGKKNKAVGGIAKFLRKIHIPVGAATIILGVYHTIFASIQHGWEFSWPLLCCIFFVLGFVTWLFRKQLKGRWIVLHRFTTLLAFVCLLIHCVPYVELIFTKMVPAVLRGTFS